MRNIAAAFAILALTAASADPGGSELPDLPPDRRPPPRPPRTPPPPLPPADPDRVRWLATEGTEHEVWSYRYAYALTEAQTGALLDRLDQISQARRQAAEEAARERLAKERAEREAARLAAWSASPLSVRCPKCNAGKGKRCQGAKVFMNTPHPERVRALERRAKAAP